ncbi:phosphatidylserine decarboxylase [Escherichia coli]
MIYVPGNLFSANHLTAQNVPNLFARNERVICLFDTEFGPMAQILVGATIVGSIRRSGGHHYAAARRYHQALDLACRGKRRFCGTAERPEMGRFNSVPPLSTCLHRVK